MDNLLKKILKNTTTLDLIKKFNNSLTKNEQEIPPYRSTPSTNLVQEGIIVVKK